MFEATDQQKAVIDEKEKNLLVSASAGTGKTTVMINRIARMLIDKSADIGDLLIITFTTAAAAEMKERLQTNLSENASTYPQLYKKLANLSQASIGTIHGFCSQLIKTYFYVADIDPNFNILEDAQSTALRKKVLDDVFEKYYIANDNLFLELLDIYGKRTEDGLQSIIMKIFEFKECIADFDNWIEKNNDPKTSLILCKNVLKNKLLRINEFYKQRAFKLREKAKFVSDRYVEAINILISGKDIPQNIDFFAIADYLSEVPSPITLRANKMEKSSDYFDEVNDEYKLIKNDWQKEYQNVLEVYTTCGKDEAINRYFATIKYRDKIVEIINNFDKVYKEEKYSKSKLDYSDLEILTLKILSETKTLQQIRNRYKYVFVDEYQDVNDVQEAIIQKITKENKTFIVGDIKQSIYGFRMSEPQNFINRENLYNQNPNENSIVPLTENFRSNSMILNFVNKIFSFAMSKDFGKTDYKSNSVLIGKNDAITSFSPVTLVLYNPDSAKQPLKKAKESPFNDDTINKNANSNESINYNDNNNENINNNIENDVKDNEIYSIESKSENSNEADYLFAKYIKSIVGTTIEIKGKSQKITFSDIAILSRTKSKLAQLYRVVQAANIPISVCYDREIFKGIEIRALVSYLRIIDNPLDEINLYAAVTGFFGSVDIEQISKLKIENSNKSFYEVIFTSENEKVIEFRNRLEKDRFISQSMTADVFITMLVNERDYRGYILTLQEGIERVQILDSFLSSISGKAESCSLSALLKYLSDSEMKGKSSSISDKDSVKLMTIHSAKGLEFPIVFVAGLNKRFNNQKSMALCNKSYGIGMQGSDKAQKRKYTTIGYEANKYADTLKDREEELRLLYVALTRAKYGLYMICEGEIHQQNKPIESVTSAFEWISFALYNSDNNDNDSCCKIERIKNVEEYELFNSEKKRSVVFSQIPDYKEEENAIRNRIEFRYPYKNDILTPIKLVSNKLKQYYEDDNEENVMFFDEDMQDNIESNGNILSDTKNLNNKTNCNLELNNTIINSALINDEKGAKNNNYGAEIAAKIGTAYHKIMETIPLQKMDKEQIDRHIQLLVNDKSIQVEIANYIKTDIIKGVLLDEQLHKHLEGKRIYREQPFMAQLDMASITGKFSGTDVILQGVIDLLLINGDEAEIIDFKYTKSLDNIKQRYAPQLNGYKKATEKILKTDKVKTYIYSIKHAKLIEI
ncbi:MAG: UvrD-helicase domain-containing protein [Clostridia bacterium]